MIRTFAPLRLLAAFLLTGLLAACAGNPTEGDRPIEMRPMGDFRLGHAVVKVDEPQVGPISRRADNEVWKSSMEAALQKRFAGYEGDAFYHIGVSIDGYSLNPPGPPMITPKSMLIVTVTVLDDTGAKLNEDGKLISVFEEFGPEFVFGSGFSRSSDEQVDVLTFNAARAIQNWMLTNPEWFGMSEDDVELPATDEAPSGA
jgi:hypothetical protein